MARLDKKNNANSITLGNDIELMILDVNQNKIVNAIPVIKRDKHDPIILGDTKFYHDNILAEFTITPYKTKQEMVTRFHDTFQKIQNHLGDKYRLVAKAAHEFDKVELDKDIRSEEIGCMPSFDAWAMGVNNPTPFENGWRSTGFHWHIGSPILASNFDARIETIKMMDCCVGVPSVLFENDETEVYRRKKYGQLGDHRNPVWGTEFRVLSSAILASREATELVYDLIDFALTNIKNNNTKRILSSVNVGEMKEAINHCNKKVAENILQKINMPKQLIDRIRTNYKKDFYNSWGLAVN